MSLKKCNFIRLDGDQACGMRVGCLQSKEPNRLPSWRVRFVFEKQVSTSKTCLSSFNSLSFARTPPSPSLIHPYIHSLTHNPLLLSFDDLNHLSPTLPLTPGVLHHRPTRSFSPLPVSASMPHPPLQHCHPSPPPSNGVIPLDD